MNEILSKIKIHKHKKKPNITSQTHCIGSNSMNSVQYVLMHYNTSSIHTVTVPLWAGTSWFKSLICNSNTCTTHCYSWCNWNEQIIKYLRCCYITSLVLQSYSRLTGVAEKLIFTFTDHILMTGCPLWCPTKRPKHKSKFQIKDEEPGSVTVMALNSQLKSHRSRPSCFQVTILRKLFSHNVPLSQYIVITHQIAAMSYG